MKLAKKEVILREVNKEIFPKQAEWQFSLPHGSDMTAEEWNWKNKDGSKPGLLYESGNWGDILKLLWLIEILRWKRSRGVLVNYFDPFAGDVRYPLGKRTRYRLECTFPHGVDPAASVFVETGWWPSSASVAASLAGGTVEVWDADPGRRANWLANDSVAVADGADGWELLQTKPADPEGVWLIDPYDFVAEWRERLPVVLERAQTTTTLLYLYNRSGRGEAQFRLYRAFRNALEDMRGELPKRIGRVAADAFLPQCYHEMIFLPGAADCRDPGCEPLLTRLAEIAGTVNAGLRRVGMCDC